MPSFKTVTMRNTLGQEYQIDLSLNDAAIMENNLEIDVTGRYRDHNEERWTEKVFTVRMEPGRKVIKVIFHNETVGTINLADIGDGLGEYFDELAGPEAWRRLQGIFLDNGGKYIEEIIQKIPVGDLVFGCLIKSGLSTAIGQLIECYVIGKVENIESLRQKVLTMLRCLGGNSLAMAGKFTYRVFKCAANGGLGIV